MHARWMKFEKVVIGQKELLVTVVQVSSCPTLFNNSRFIYVLVITTVPLNLHLSLMCINQRVISTMYCSAACELMFIDSVIYGRNQKR